MKLVAMMAACASNRVSAATDASPRDVTARSRVVLARH